MLKEIITKWLGEEEKDEEEFSAKLMEKQVGYSYTKAYNQALTDLKSRIPELEEMIIGIIQEKQDLFDFVPEINGYKYIKAKDLNIINTLKGFK